MKKLGYSLSERSQNFWEILSIQGVSFGMPGMVLSATMAQKYGIGTTITSIAIGGLILWLISLAIISMSFQSRSNAIENAKKHLGVFSGIFFLITLFSLFIIWYILQLNSGGSPLYDFLQAKGVIKSDIYSFIRFGALFGLITALLSSGGIKLIKYFSLVAFPLVLVFILFESSRLFFLPIRIGSWKPSLVIVISTVLIELPGAVNLPTFFRHASNRAHSLSALTLLTIYIMIYQFAGISLSQYLSPSFLVAMQSAQVGFWELTFAFLFVLITLVGTNLINIYFASAAIEMLLPKVSGPKVFSIIGLSGTAAFTVIQVSKPVIFLENVGNAFISSLAIILMISFIITVIVKHRPRIVEKSISTFCWLLGCMFSLYDLIGNGSDSTEALLLGIRASSLAFLVVIFIEESVWAFSSLRNKSEDTGF